MTVDENIFNDFCTKNGYGQLFFPKDKQLLQFKLQCDALLNLYKANPYLLKLFPKINFNIIGSGEVNAFAALKEINYGIIGVYEGTKLILCDIFNRMFSYKQILSNIGNADNEIHTEPSLRNFYTDASSLANWGDLNYGDYQLLVPIDPVRRKYAVHLTQLALGFIFEHELSHILNGHLNYTNEKFNMAKIHLNPYKNNIPIITYQTLEMDADCSALLKCMSLLEYDVSHPQNLQEDMRFLYADIEQCFSDLMLAIYMTIRLFGDGFYTPEESHKDNHAPPRVRQIYLQASMMHMLQSYKGPVNLQNLHTKLMLVVSESEKAYQLITGNSTNLEAFEERNYAKHPLANEMMEHWKIIKAEVLSHAYIKVFH